MRLLASALALASTVNLTPSAPETMGRWLSRPTRKVSRPQGTATKAQRKKARKAQTAARRNNRK